MLLPIFGKIFERILFKSLFNFIQENNRPYLVLTKYQLLLIVHDIHASFDSSPPLDVRGIFLDIFKAFDEVWHE